MGGMTPFLEKFRLESLEPWIFLALAVILSLGLMATSDRPGTESVRVRTTEILEVFTRPFNLLGCPALSLPCGFSLDGLPLALQIAGKPFAEETVLQVGHAYEQSTDWHQRQPKI